ncbi:hypothetical protein KC19_4G207500 [Ceratodon purpureus]|uniref:Uncharacterized protein n=1 Tax=Ceratodon purpureus TaxID=3225 RepID=A0A8T0IEG6_CERPU|nr:hypothetical protein KC19_4G207500 [Ceratodon purpureus]
MSLLPRRHLEPMTVQGMCIAVLAMAAERAGSVLCNTLEHALCCASCLGGQFAWKSTSWCRPQADLEFRRRSGCVHFVPGRLWGWLLGFVTNNSIALSRLRVLNGCGGHVFQVLIYFVAEENWRMWMLIRRHGAFM